MIDYRSLVFGSAQDIRLFLPSQAVSLEHQVRVNYSHPDECGKKPPHLHIVTLLAAAAGKTRREICELDKGLF